MSAHFFRFVILEKDCFIARDMQDGLQSACPNADIRRIATPEDVANACGDAQDSVRPVIITKLSVEQLDRAGISSLSRQIGAEIVVRMGDDPLCTVAERGWLSLASPFTWDDLAALVGDLVRRPAA